MGRWRGHSQERGDRSPKPKSPLSPRRPSPHHVYTHPLPGARLPLMLRSSGWSILLLLLPYSRAWAGGAAAGLCPPWAPSPGQALPCACPQRKGWGQPHPELRRRLCPNPAPCTAALGAVTRVTPLLTTSAASTEHSYGATCPKGWENGDPSPSSQHGGAGPKQLFRKILHLHHMWKSHILLLLAEGPDSGAGLDLQLLDVGPTPLPCPDNLPPTVQGHAGRCPKPLEVRAAAGQPPPTR